MQNLNEAIADLRDCAGEGFTPSLITEIAEDYDLNPALLDRKFNEKFGCAPSDYRKPVPIEFTEEQFKERWEAGMKRAWREHPEMYWNLLSERRKASARIFLMRHWGNENLSIVFKR